MKIYAISLLMLFAISSSGWENDFDTAKQKAKSQHRLILLEFSGSDWCVPCIRFRKEVLETTEFTGYADTSLVLLKADFPRLKKNQLSKTQQEKNEKLADLYNPTGIFPMTILLDADGKKLKVWEGYPDLNSSEFISQINQYRNARN
ncbi:MAG TPA: thioredoxin family protein [Chitinophagaceae bacterium]|nr:thioredoxin family protein [Chitinophagaceae bacterium]